MSGCWVQHIQSFFFPLILYRCTRQCIYFYMYVYYRVVGPRWLMRSCFLNRIVTTYFNGHFPLLTFCPLVFLLLLICYWKEETLDHFIGAKFTDYFRLTESKCPCWTSASKQGRWARPPSFPPVVITYIDRFKKKWFLILLFFLSFAGLVRTREAVPGGDWY